MFHTICTAYFKRKNVIKAHLNMSSLLSVQILDGDDKCSQKCILPFHLYEKSHLKLGKYVSIKSERRVYVCRLSITMLPLTCVFIDDLVMHCSELSECQTTFKEKITFPGDFFPLEVSKFSHINVKILLKENTTLKINRTTYEGVVHQILSYKVFGKNCFVNCSELKLAKIFDIIGVLVTETSLEADYAKITKLTTIQINDITSWERLQQIDSFGHLPLGGLSDAEELLTFNLIQSYKSLGVLITGPPGSGKSSLVKQFCCGVDGYLVVIDRLLGSDLTVERCKKYCEQYSNYLQIFPDQTCMLFIDQLDDIVPYNSKSDLSTVSVFVSLLNHMKELGIYTIATAVHKKNINPVVGARFDREVTLGIPSFQQRKEIIAALSQKFKCSIDCDKVAHMMPGFVGHDISLLIKEAIDIRQSQEATQLMEPQAEDTNNLICLSSGEIEKALLSVSPSVLKTSLWNIKVKPVYWSDIGGMFHVKKRLQMCIEWPLRFPDVFQKVDLPCPHGVLLFGPPGCCKTTLARGLATECNANFFAANPAQIYSPYVGESEKNLMELFYQARLCSPSIIFLDELDSLVSKRKLDKKSQGVGEKVLSTLLNEMDGFGTKMQFQTSMNMQLLKSHKTIDQSKEETLEKQPSNNDVIVVAATNRPDLIDDALLRPGRFDVILYVPPPNTEERESILQTLMQGRPVSDDICLKNIAKNTEFFSGADLKNLCNEAAMNALRHDMSASFIVKENFDEALRKIKPSITRSQLEMYEKLSSKYGTVIKSL